MNWFGHLNTKAKLLGGFALVAASAAGIGFVE